MTTRAEMELHALRVGSGLDGLYTRALRVGAAGVEGLQVDLSWGPFPGLDDLYLRGQKDRRRWPLGPGVWQVGDGPIRPLGRDAVIVLAVVPGADGQQRAALDYAELLVDGQVKARFRRGRWYTVDKAAEAPTLLLGPAEHVGPSAVEAAGARSRLSPLAERLGV